MTEIEIGTRGTFDAGDGCLYHATLVGYVDVRCPVIKLDPPRRSAWLYEPSEPEPFPVLPDDFTEDQ